MSGPPRSALWSMNSAAPRPPSTRCRFFLGAEAAPTSASAPRRKPRPSSRRRTTRSKPRRRRRARLSAGACPGRCTAAAALCQRQARPRQYSHRRHCRRAQRLGGRAEIHPSNRHRARARRFRHRFGPCPRHRHGGAHGSLGHGTIAVLAGGIDIVYPPENEELQHAIGERGLLISERSPGFSRAARISPPQPADLGDLPRRGGDRGRRALGSLITARFAGEQGREVFAVPAARSIRARRDQQSPEAGRLPRHLGARYPGNARADPRPAPCPAAGRACCRRRASGARAAARHSPKRTRVDRVSAWSKPGRYRRADPRHRRDDEESACRAARARSGRQAATAWAAAVSLKV